MKFLDDRGDNEFERTIKKSFVLECEKFSLLIFLSRQGEGLTQKC